MPKVHHRTKKHSVRRLWIGIGILLFLTPLGILIPNWLGARGSWGEWGPEQVEKIAGFIPDGMRRLGNRWKAPMTDYAVPGQGTGAVREGAGYLLTGIIGAAATVGVVYLLTRLFTRGKDSGKNDD